MKLDLKDLTGSGEEIEYKGVKVHIQPLSVREQAMFGQYQADKKFGEASSYVFRKTLHRAIPEWSEQEIDDINDSEFIELVTAAMMKVNGWQAKKKEQVNQEAPQKQ